MDSPRISFQPATSWTPLNCTPVNDDWKSASTWGASYNAALIAWTSFLLWPPTSHEASSAEISWAELLVSFRLETKCPIPIPCAIHKGTYITEGIHYVPTLDARPLGDEVKAFVHSLRTLTTITVAQIMPWDQTKKIKLVRFGRGLQVQGGFDQAFLPTSGVGSIPPDRLFYLCQWQYLDVHGSPLGQDPPFSCAP